jgi:uncharacterized protein YndB with AHSA1/START domain
MDVSNESEATPMKNRTTVERKSERELVVTRIVNAPARLVFEAWTKPELLKQWWVPKSYGLSLLSCEADARVGGKYRLLFRHGTSEPMAFFGTYLEVTPHSRLVWSNEEAGDAGQISTVTFEEKAGKTLVVMHELYRQLGRTARRCARVKSVLDRCGFSRPRLNFYRRAPHASTQARKSSPFSDWHSGAEGAVWRELGGVPQSQGGDDSQVDRAQAGCPFRGACRVR